MKYWLVVVQWMVLATAMAAPATAPKPAPPGNRFLFVLETSAGMSRLEHGGRQAIFDLIYSGVEGRMRKGDTYGIWTFNEQVSVGFYPMQIWDGQRNLEHASAAGRFLKTQKYEKEGHLTNLMSQLQTVLRVAKDLSVFIVTDGDTLVKGTPFDDEINTAYRASAVQVRYTSKPLVTTLTARNGEFTSALVSLAGEKIVLAHLPPQTNETVAVAKAPVPATNDIVTSASPKPVGKVISISDVEAAAKAELEKAKNTSAPKIATVAAQSNDGPAVVIDARPVVAVKTNALPPTNVVEQPVIVVPPPVSVTPSNVAAAPRPANAAASVARVSIAATNETPSKPEPLPAFVPAQIEVAARSPRGPAPGPNPLLSGNMMLVFGGVFVGASLLGGLIFARRMRRTKHPSFISQGMDRS
jgi:hypothetical protein